MKLVPFITAGFPTVDGFWKSLRELDEGGAEVIEIGVPFSDPVADGPVIEAASIRALENGITLEYIVEELRKRKGQYTAKLALMGYMNPFLQYGFERLATACKEAGVYSLIIPDLPLDEDAAYRSILKEQGVHLIPLIAPNTPDERMQAYSDVAGGYAYIVSALGVTGVRDTLPPQAIETIRRARKHFKLPLALGFGLSSPDQLAGIAKADLPDMIIFGSALAKHLDEGRSAAEFMQRWQGVRD